MKTKKTLAITTAVLIALFSSGCDVLENVLGKIIEEALNNEKTTTDREKREPRERAEPWDYNEFFPTGQSELRLSNQVESLLNNFSQERIFDEEERWRWGILFKELILMSTVSDDQWIQLIYSNYFNIYGFPMDYFEKLVSNNREYLATFINRNENNLELRDGMNDPLSRLYRFSPHKEEERSLLYWERGFKNLMNQIENIEDGKFEQRHADMITRYYQDIIEHVMFDVPILRRDGNLHYFNEFGYLYQTIMAAKAYNAIGILIDFHQGFYYEGFRGYNSLEELKELETEIERRYNRCRTNIGYRQKEDTSYYGGEEEIQLVKKV